MYKVQEVKRSKRDLLSKIEKEITRLDKNKLIRTEFRNVDSKLKKGTFHEARIGSVKQKGTRGQTLGRFKSSNKSETIVPTKFRPLFSMLQNLYRSHFGKSFNAVRVNCRIKSKKHKDGKNVGVSTILGVGSYSGGRLKLYLKDIKMVSIKNRFVTFNSADIAHATEPFKGARYSFVFFGNH